MFDHPLSSRFDEQDAVVIFDDVVVPRERMFLAGDPEIYNKAMTTGWVANIMQQTTIRAHVKLRFAWELATQMSRAVNADSPAVNELLGEMWSYAELTRAVVEAAEAGAHEWGNGVWFCDERPFRAIRPTLPRWFPRANEIIKLLGAHSLLATPTRAELDNPELRPLIDIYYQGANGMTRRGAHGHLPHRLGPRRVWPRRSRRPLRALLSRIVVTDVPGRPDGVGAGVATSRSSTTS